MVQKSASSGMYKVGCSLSSVAMYLYSILHVRMFLSASAHCSATLCPVKTSPPIKMTALTMATRPAMISTVIAPGSDRTILFGRDAFGNSTQDGSSSCTELRRDVVVPKDDLDDVPGTKPLADVNNRATHSKTTEHNLVGIFFGSKRASRCLDMYEAGCATLDCP